MTKTIKIDGYPAHFEFKIRAKLPKFISSGTIGKDYDCEYCEVRNHLLLKYLKRLKINSPYHEYEDYVVEVVTETEDGEIWQLGF